jgi:hypothetical protein
MEQEKFAYCKLTPKQRQERGCKLDKRLCEGCSYFAWITEDDLKKSKDGLVIDEEILNKLWK